MRIRRLRDAPVGAAGASLAALLRVRALRLALFVVVAVGALAAAPVSGGEAPPAAAEEDAPVFDYAGSWEYRWGDSPREKSGELAWAQPSAGGDWRPCSLPGTPPGRAGNSFLWLRTRLAGPKLTDPALFLLTVDQIFEAYIDGRRVYRFGVLDGPGAGRFAGYKPHFIPLGTGYQGKTLTLRIYSAHVNIGVIGEVAIGDRIALTVATVRGGQDKLLIGAVLAVLGLASLVLYALRRQEQTYRDYGGFALSIGIYMCCQAQCRSLLINAPLLWVYVEIFSLYCIPPFIIGYMMRMLGRGPWGLTVRLIQLHWLYLAVSALLVVTGIVPLMATWLPFTALMMFNLIYILGMTVLAAVQGNVEARIFCGGLVFATVLCLYDILSAIGILPRRTMTSSHIGTAVFVISLAIIPARRVVRLQKRLADYSTVLQMSLASTSMLEPGGYAKAALDQLIRLLQARRALLFLFRADGGALELREGRDAHGASLADWQGFDSGAVDTVRRSRRPLVIFRQTEDLPAPADGGEPAVRGSGTSLMAAPLLFRDQLLGVLYLEAESVRPIYGEGDVELLLGLANQLAVALHTERAVNLELENKLAQRRMEEQQALLQAAVRMATGDLATPIAVQEESPLRHLAGALEGMRKDLQDKFRQLEASNAKVRSLNEELMRQIEQRSRRLLEALLQQQSAHPAPMRSGGAGSTLAPGTLLGEVYRVIRNLGQGAMGVVYEVERTTDGQRFAAKVLIGDADKTSIIRFAREAQLLSKLTHPNLISIVDVDITASGTLFIVMELVRGTTLRQLRPRYGDLAWALPLLRQTAAALAAVHARGIIHRDLKPANILIAEGERGEGPQVKLADFGISVLMRGDEPQQALAASPMAALLGGGESEPESTGASVPPSPPPPRAVPSRAVALPPDAPTRIGQLQPPATPDVTEIGMLVGTPMYMAPELSSGSRNARPPSDVFSLGVIAYELITKEMPFKGPPIGAVVRQETLLLPSGLRKRKDLPQPLVELIERCLCVDPGQRPTAQQVADVLTELAPAPVG